MKWTAEETAFLYLHLNKTAKEIYAKYTKKFGKKRTFKSIEVKASSLRKKKSGSKLEPNTRAVGKKPKPSPKPKKKTSKKKISNKKKCRTCGVELTEDNQYPSMRKNGARQCKKCWSDYLKERKKLKKVLSAKTEKVVSKETKKSKLSYSDLEKLLKQKKKDISGLRTQVSQLKSQVHTLSTTAVLSEQSWKAAFEDYTKKMENLLAEAKKKPLTRRERRKLKKQQKLQAKLDKLVGENNDNV
tara:strand:+ start:3775 stop:4503 length:729 start_codon:yes stop_codon:yes gene_type:complete